MWANEVDALEKIRAQLEVCHSSQPARGPHGVLAALRVGGRFLLDARRSTPQLSRALGVLESTTQSSCLDT